MADADEVTHFVHHRGEQIHAAGDIIVAVDIRCGVDVPAPAGGVGVDGDGLTVGGAEVIAGEIGDGEGGGVKRSGLLAGQPGGDPVCGGGGDG